MFDYLKLPILILALFFAFSIPAFAADRYWVGGTGSWSQTTHWSTTSGGSNGAAVPTVDDNVIFDSASSAGSYTVTVNTGAKTLDLTTSAPASGVMTLAGTSALEIRGSLSFHSTLNRTYTGVITFSATDARTVSLNGISLGANTFFSGSDSGSWNLLSNFTSTGRVTFTQGTFDANDFNVSVGLNFVATGDTPVTLRMGAGNWTSSATASVFSIGSGSNIVIVPETSTIKITDASGSQKNFQGGSKTYNNFDFSGSGSIRIQNSNTFNDFKVTAGTSVYFGQNTVQTTTTVNTFTASGGVGNLVSLLNFGTGPNLIVKNNSGVVDADYLSITNIDALPADTWYAGTHSVDNGGNSGWIYTAPPPVLINDPADGDTIGGSTVNISADTYENNFDVVGVQFQIDGQDIGSEDVSAPYAISWDSKTVSSGTHTLTAIARNPDDDTFTSAPITVEVDNGSVSLVASSSGNGSATITWLSDDLTSSRVQFGPTSAYGQETSETDLSPRVYAHSVSINDLDKCTNYHYRVASTDAEGRVYYSEDSAFLTRGCDEVYTGLDESCDAIDPNSLIRVRTDRDVTEVRNSIINFIWKDGGGLPARQPDTVTHDTGSVPGLTTSGMANLARIDQIDINMEGGYNSQVYHLIPTVSNNRLVIYHLGHGDVTFDSVGGGWETIDFLIEHGFSVLAYQMPATGPNMTPDGLRSSEGHAAMADYETDSFNPMKIFLEPLAVGLDYIDQNYSYSDVSMVGISGGGWTTYMYAAIDPRIKLSIPVGGIYPSMDPGCDTSDDSDSGGTDYEQGSMPDTYPKDFFTNVASKLDLRVLGAAGADRKMINVPCCTYPDSRFNVYESAVSSWVRELSGGTFDVMPDTFDSTISPHRISLWMIDNIIFPELQENVTINPIDSSSYRLALNSKPIANVTVSLSSSNSKAILKSSTLTFTPENWNVPQNVIVKSDKNKLSTTIYHSVVSDDELYDGVNIEDVDLETPSASVSGSYSSSLSSTVPISLPTAPGCKPGDKFSSATGEPCGSAIVSPSPSVNSSPEESKPTCSIIATLKIGSKGNEVKCLQNTIQGSLIADGIFGSKTKAAVISFQKENGLVPDGIFGSKSKAVWALLF